jgi:hypothetical protein
MNTSLIKLSEKQIEFLFNFTRKKFVHWYDLQLEIVDHLASCIEEKMTLDTNLPFEDALEQVYKDFGIFGFHKIVQENEVQLIKTSKTKWLNELKQLLNFPFVILIILLAYLTYSLASFLKQDQLYYYFLICYIPFTLLYTLIIYRDRKLRERLLVLQSSTMSYSYHFLLDYAMPFYIHTMSVVSFAIILTVAIVIKIVSLKLYFKIRNEAKILYPSVFA